MTYNILFLLILVLLHIKLGDQVYNTNPECNLGNTSGLLQLENGLTVSLI